MGEQSSYRFSHAIVRRPSESSVNGLRAVDTGKPDLQRFQEHHEQYVSVLKSAGATVIELTPDTAWGGAAY